MYVCMRGMGPWGVDGKVVWEGGEEFMGGNVAMGHAT